MDAQNKRIELIKIKLAVALCIFGCALIVSGFIVAPLGVIHNSVLIAFGEIMTFVGAVLGINYAYSTKIKELETKLEQEKMCNKSDEILQP